MSKVINIQTCSFCEIEAVGHLWDGENQQYLWYCKRHKGEAEAVKAKYVEKITNPKTYSVWGELGKKIGGE